MVSAVQHFSILLYADILLMMYMGLLRKRSISIPKTIVIGAGFTGLDFSIKTAVFEGYPVPKPAPESKHRFPYVIGTNQGCVKIALLMSALQRLEE